MDGRRGRRSSPGTYVLLLLSLCSITLFGVALVSTVS